MTRHGGTTMTKLPWEERVPMLRENPCSAALLDITRLAADLMDARRLIQELCVALDAMSPHYRAANQDAPFNELFKRAGYERIEL